ncbi:DUF3667 domain-containing protein [Ulvibacterium marinum]|uniref:DUF3667 domain-containing protein n=1 Tax=Ulvibacterium marinum TaxID=2419782 RepID=UPI0024954C5A|nr:DUF3667 domain-containing protein [Ulvibacterium marinum]
MMKNKPVITSRGRYQLKYRGTECLNCGHPLDLSDKYCPNCSQANSTKKLTIKDYFDEFFSNMLSYDSKLLKTLSALLIRPGKITRDYVDGKRMSYTNPFRFLLSLAIIYFLIQNFSGNFSELDKYGVDKQASPIDFQGPFGIELDVGDENREEAIKVLDSIGISEQLDRVVDYRDSLIMENPQAHFASLDSLDFSDRFYTKAEFFNTLIRKDGVYTLKDAIGKYQVPESFENKMSFGAAAGFVRASRQPGSFISSLISKLPFAVFFFLPVFTLFIGLVYIRKKYTYTDHLVFSFHNTSLLFILLIISYLIDSIFDVSSNWIFITVFSIYLLKAMRKFYQQGAFKTIVKYLFLNAIFFILAMFGVVFLLAGNIFTY